MKSNQDSTGCRMALIAYRWDHQAALPALRAAANLEVCQRDGLLAAARIESGDTAAAAEWSAAFNLRMANFAILPRDLAILWLFPDNPVLRVAAEILFAHADSPLSPRSHFDEIASPLLAVPVYRRAVLEALQDIRVKDMVATALSRIEGFPAFQPDWPAPMKDAAIQEFAAILRSQTIRAFPDRLADTECSVQKVYLAKQNTQPWRAALQITCPVI